MEVVDHQHLGSVRPLQVVGQCGDDIGRDLTLEAQELTGVLTDVGLPVGASHGLDDGGDEPDRVGVGDVTAEPRPWALRAISRPSRPSSAVLPAPGEPTTSVRRARCPRSSSSSSLDRCTRWDDNLGTENFDDGNRGLRGPTATLPFLSVIFSRPLAASLGLVSPSARWSFPAANVYWKLSHP